MLRRKFLGRPDISAETGHIRFKAGHVLRRVSAAMLVHYFGHILLTGCPIDPILFCSIHIFEGIISMLLVGVFITLL
jgi:hypothetical protein